MVRCNPERRGVLLGVCLSACNARYPLMQLTDLQVRKEKPGELVERQHGGVRVRRAGQRVDTG